MDEGRVHPGKSRVRARERICSDRGDRSTGAVPSNRQGGKNEAKLFGIEGTGTWDDTMDKLVAG